MYGGVSAVPDLSARYRLKSAFWVGDAQFVFRDLRQAVADDEPARHSVPQGIVYGGDGHRGGPGLRVVAVGIGIGADDDSQAFVAAGTDAGGGIQQGVDREYDTNQALAAVRARCMTPLVPSKQSRKEPKSDEAAPCQARHPVENCYGQLKGWRGVATQCATPASQHLAMWARIF